MRTWMKALWIRAMAQPGHRAVGLCLPGIAVILSGLAAVIGLGGKGEPKADHVIKPDYEVVQPERSLHQYPPGTRDYSKIELNGQDVDGDGIATTEEGQIDVDGDGKFTEVEMNAYGLTSYICWARPDETYAFSITCSAICQIVPPYGNVCVVQTDPTWMCKGDASGNCTGSIPCASPCDCP